MRALFFDTETTGMVEFKKPATDPRQPDLIQLALTLVDLDTKRQLASYSTVVAPPWDFEIHPKAAEANGMTKEFVLDCGIDTPTAIAIFMAAYELTDIVVGHNVNFDRRIMETAAHRSKWPDAGKLTKPLVCTMMKSTKIVKARHADGRPGKWPTLVEAYRFFTGRNLDGAHDALVDLGATQEVFTALIDGGHLNLEEVVLGGR